MQKISPITFATTIAVFATSAFGRVTTSNTNNSTEAVDAIQLHKRFYADGSVSVTLGLDSTNFFVVTVLGSDRRVKDFGWN